MVPVMKTLGLITLTFASTALAAPSGPHPRLFMSSSNLAAFTANAGQKGTAAAGIVAQCQDTIANAKDYNARGGSDGNAWPGSAVSCAFAYLVTNNAQYLTQAIKYWQAALNDDQTIGDGKGCVAGVSTNWPAWDGNPPAPPVILTVTHDTGYPMRWYGPDLALTYDWLYSAPGVSSTLLGQTRTCLTAWNDWYTQKGYLRDQPGGNYNAGFIASKTLSAIAIGTDGGADGHLWNEITTQQFPQMLVAEGLAPGGAMNGGDWLEGWQYGPLSVLEYATATRALEAAGMPQPEMDAWASSLAVRYIYSTVPKGDAMWVGGDFDSMDVYQSPSVNVLDAVLVGPSSETAAGYAAFMKQAQSLKAGPYIYNAIAELRTTTPVDYKAQTPAPSLYYLSKGSRALYARSSWGTDAFWGVISSPPKIVSDHLHLAAGTFVFSRGGDHLIVDSQNYGDDATFESNAIAVEADLRPDYNPSQTPWSKADLPWARGTADGVFAARSDFGDAFIWSDPPSKISYAHREWVMLPEGEMVTIDRVQTADASHNAYLGFHANTGGTLKLSGNVAAGTVGGSQIAIHAVSLSGGTPMIVKPPVGSCTLQCSYPCGMCSSARFAVDDYTVKIPGPWAVAIHAFDALAAADQPARVDSINSDAVDPSPKQNAGVIGAAVYRGGKQSYIVASSAMQGAAGAMLTYGVPGVGASRHIVFDAPEDSSGASSVSATATSGRCVVTITPSGTAGSGFAGHPLLFQVSSAADGCKTTESTTVPSASPPPGGGFDAGSFKDSDGGTSPSGGLHEVQGGCGCVVARGHGAGLLALLLALVFALRLRRAQR
jgi:hypothetical protein